MAKEPRLRARVRTWVVLGLLVVFGLWAATIPLLALYIPDNPTGEPAGSAVAIRGQLGDAFGVVNALFSGLAFLGVVVAIRQQAEARDQQAHALGLQLEAIKIQQTDLRLQLKEMQETREAMSRQADAAEKQEAALEKQRRAMLLGAAISAQGALSAGITKEIQQFGHMLRNPDDSDPTQHTKAMNTLFGLLVTVLDELDMDHEATPRHPPRARS